MSASALRLEGASFSYGSVEVLRELRLDVRVGEFVAIVGPSGCGKTTLLNLLSGNLEPSAGKVVRAGRTRTVYQQDGLFPWLTVAENIQMGLQEIPDPAARQRGLAELVRLIRLEGFEGHYPYQLSGGMKQRVELARALAGESDILLMDEPFSALDYQTRLRMRRELARLLQERPRTVIFVTHDIEEAAQLADRVAVLTARPASISRELRLDVPRPRPLTHPSVIEATEQILEEMGLRDEEESLPKLEIPLPRSAAGEAVGRRV
jgi:ABC-type nitrate/sulfonate/bicarbonate transport system ATPase subunit